MRIKALVCLSAACLLAIAAWQVQRGSGVDQPPLAENSPALGEENRLSEVPEKYRDTVKKGLAYLAKQQHKDGHWEGEAGQHPVAMTGLVGIALLMEQHRRGQARMRIWTPPKYAVQIGKAAEWLTAQSQARPSGLIYADHPSETDRYMEGHGLATIFLAGAWHYERGEARSKKMREVLARAVEYIAKAQSSRGGWYHTSRAEGHDFDAMLPTAIQIQALQAAESVGIAISRDVMKDGEQYLLTALADKKAKLKPEEEAAALATIAMRDACRPKEGKHEGDGHERLLDKWTASWLAETPAECPSRHGRDGSTHYFLAQAVYYGAGKWEHYRPALFDRVQSAQNKDGSWPAAEGVSAGQVYATAIWCSILSLDQNSHPATLPFMGMN